MAMAQQLCAPPLSVLLMHSIPLFGPQIGSHIKKQVGELGFSCTGLVTKAGALQCSPNDSFTKKELIESARKVSEKVRNSLQPYCCHALFVTSRNRLLC